MRVGCIGLFGGDPTLRLRGARNTHLLQSVAAAKELTHAPPIGHNHSLARLSQQPFSLRDSLTAAERRQSPAPIRMNHERLAPRASGALACSAATQLVNNAERATLTTRDSRRQLGNLTTPGTQDATAFLHRDPARKPLNFVFRHEPPNAGITRAPMQLT